MSCAAVIELGTRCRGRIVEICNSARAAKILGFTFIDEVPNKSGTVVVEVRLTAEAVDRRPVQVDPDMTGSIQKAGGKGGGVVTKVDTPIDRSAPLPRAESTLICAVPALASSRNSRFAP